MAASPHTRLFPFGLLLTLYLVFSPPYPAQQPFYTDDADVTPKRHFHFEFSNEFDALKRDVFPTLNQNTADFELNYGLFEGLEIGIAAPMLTLIADSRFGPRSVYGVGDTNISAKYNFLQEHEHSKWPAMTISVNLKLPTGSVKKALGSGLADFHMNGIVQKSITAKTKLRLNGGLLFSGNETTGVIGIKTRGLVLTGGASLVRKFTPKLTLGVEFTGAITRKFDLGKAAAQTLAGGNYQVLEHMSFDFGVLGGKFVASPRFGVQVGVSVDW